MYQEITFNSYLKKILCIAVLYITLPILLSGLAGSNTTSSYIASVICFLILTLISVKLILGANKYVKFYAAAFVIQVLIGLAHYLYFIEHNYFITSGDAAGAMWHEYLSVFEANCRLQDARNTLGLLYWMDADEFQVSHPEIWHFISYPFYFLGQKWLSYATLNIYSGLLSSMNIMFLYLRRDNFDQTVSKHLMFWTAFFPSFILNDTVWRDPFGVCLMSIGLVLLLLGNTIVAKVFSFVFLGAVSFMQRTIYLLLAGVSVFWGYLQKTQSLFLKFLCLCFGIVIFFMLKDIADEATGAEYTSSYVNAMSYLALPIKIVFGMIGPFPWTQFSMLVERNPAFAWQLQDYVMGTFQFGYLIAIVVNWKHINFKDLDVMTVMGFGIMLSGFLSRQMHIGYISEGLLFTLPWYFSQIGEGYKKYLRFSFIILVSLNILLLLMGNMGIGSIWK